jgi:hypothetical protein
MWNNLTEAEKAEFNKRAEVIQNDPVLKDPEAMYKDVSTLFRYIVRSKEVQECAAEVLLLMRLPNKEGMILASGDHAKNYYSHEIVPHCQVFDDFIDKDYVLNKLEVADSESLAVSKDISKNEIDKNVRQFFLTLYSMLM